MNKALGLEAQCWGLHCSRGEDRLQVWGMGRKTGEREHRHRERGEEREEKREQGKIRWQHGTREEEGGGNGLREAHKDMRG